MYHDDLQKRGGCGVEVLAKEKQLLIFPLFKVLAV